MKKDALEFDISESSKLEIRRKSESTDSIPDLMASFWLDNAGFLAMGVGREWPPLSPAPPALVMMPLFFPAHPQNLSSTPHMSPGIPSERCVRQQE